VSSQGQSDSSHSFVDLMVSLAIIFILLLVATLNNMAQASQETVKDLRKEVVEQLKVLGLTLHDDPEDRFVQVIRLDDQKLKFDFKKADLHPEGAKLIDNLFLILAPKLCEPQFAGKIESVIIEGHTDKVGNDTLEGRLFNVKLSEDRAFAVMKEAFYMLDGRGMKNEEEGLRKLVSAVGRGSSKPLPDLPDGASRRVEIKIRVRNAIPSID
jgi:outer membrane protein OmpA-like peptidoglycan-associated protein